MMIDKTEWFTTEIKPIRTGVYQTWQKNGIWFQYWNGDSWASYGDSPTVAFRNRYCIYADQQVSWRGLNYMPIHEVLS